MHDTPVSLFVAKPDGLEAGWRDHSVPFQLSARLIVMPWLLVYDPTLVHALEDMQDADCNLLSVAPLGLGVLWIAHSVPFQRSARLTVVPELLTYSPAAVHTVAEAHDTDRR
jgi:hypothetical protein